MVLLAVSDCRSLLGAIFSRVAGCDGGWGALGSSGVSVSRSRALAVAAVLAWAAARRGLLVDMLLLLAGGDGELWTTFLRWRRLRPGILGGGGDGGGRRLCLCVCETGTDNGQWMGRVVQDLSR